MCRIYGESRGKELGKLNTNLDCTVVYRNLRVSKKRGPFLEDARNRDYRTHRRILENLVFRSPHLHAGICVQRICA